MKTATLPSVRVEPELCDAAGKVLPEGEFNARGIASRDEARRTGEYVASSEVLERLVRRLDTLRDRRRQVR
ncbi:prevent-host-death protein [Burkholderia sp. Bp9002]|nr:prevent-host-death protein [Burkholderia sp. Bp9002]